MRSRFAQVSRKKPGAPPGSLVHVGEQKQEATRITLIEYDPVALEERTVERAAECPAAGESGRVSWINVDGIHEVEVLATLGKRFGVHPLVQEDILNTEHRPKFEDHDAYLFLVLKMLFFDEARGEIVTEQVSLLLVDGSVLSFQEKSGDVFDGVRERLRSGKGRIRRMGGDYLAYALLDAVVDSYFLLLEQLGDQIESLEEELVTEPTPATLHKIHTFKREMILLRKSIWPLREAVSALQRSESALLSEGTTIFYQDVYDHAVQVVDTVETLRDLVSGMLDLYLSSVSNRMNEVMKVLTIMATIFIPLSFIAGIYGMNFEHIPELKWRWGYAAFWGLIVALAGGMLCFFRRRKWL